jgi:hypothetical protein
MHWNKVFKPLSCAHAAELQDHHRAPAGFDFLNARLQKDGVRRPPN